MLPLARVEVLSAAIDALILRKTYPRFCPLKAMRAGLSVARAIAQFRLPIMCLVGKGSGSGILRVCPTRIPKRWLESQVLVVF